MGRIVAAGLQPATSFNGLNGAASASRKIVFTLPELPLGFSWVHPNSIYCLRPENPKSASAQKVHSLAVDTLVYLWKPNTEGFELGYLQGRVCNLTTVKCLCVDVSQQPDNPNIIIAEWDDLTLGQGVFLACDERVFIQKKLTKIDAGVDWLASISSENAKADLEEGARSGSLNSHDYLLLKKNKPPGIFQKIFGCCISDKNREIYS